MGLRGRLKRAERAAREEMIEVRQADGTVARFPQSDGIDAFLALMDGRDHPLAQAVRNSPDPEWEKSVYNNFPIDPDTPDLSEP
jgi:hypothetical protein